MSWLSIVPQVSSPSMVLLPKKRGVLQNPYATASRNDARMCSPPCMEVVAVRECSGGGGSEVLVVKWW